MIVLSCNNISKLFGIDVILSNISFHINDGEKIGIVGINGAGKSTLFKLLIGELSPDDGDLFISKTSSLGYLQQNANLNIKSTVFNEVLTVFTPLISLENDLRSLEIEIASLSKSAPSSSQLQKHMDAYSLKLDEFNRKNGYSFRSEAKGVLKGLGFSEEEFEQPIRHLSGGQKTRIALAKLLLSRPDILLLDEPTNHLDIAAVEWLEGFLRDYFGTVLIISHDRYFLDQLVNRVLEIENHELISYNGNFSEFMEKKRIIYQQKMKAYLDQQKEIEKQKDIIRRLRQHGTEKLMNRAKSKEKQFSKINQIEAPKENKKRALIRFETQLKSGQDILNIDNLCKSFGEEPLFKDLLLQVYKGERIAIIGANGIGKSTLFKIIAQKITPTSGKIALGHNVHIGYYDQELNDLHFDKIVIDEIWDDHISMDQTQIRTLLGSFLFHGEEVFKPVNALSGGEKARLSLLKLILSKSNFLLLDEPTNHLDIHAKEVLEDALLRYDGTVLMISHDRYFLNRVATKIIDFTPNGLELFLGNYDYYLYKKKQQHLELEEDTPQKNKTQLKEEKKREKEEKQRLRQIEKSRQDIEKEIADLEIQLEELESLMCQQEIYSNPIESKRIHKESLCIKERIDTLYEQWENYV